MTTSKNAETLALHAGPRMDPTTGAVAVPIYQTTAYQFRDTEHAADSWQLHGLARPLLDRLERQAAASGIRRMVADTLLANREMLGLAARAGYAVTASRDDAMLARLEKRLAPSAAPLLS